MFGGAELREYNTNGEVLPEEITGGCRKERLQRVCAKCNGARTTSGRPEERHRCPPRLPSNFYWTGYGIEARDPEQPEWLKVETLCEAVAAGGDIRYQIQQLLAKVRKLDECGATLENTDLPELPSDWLRGLRTRERCSLERGRR